MTSLFISDLHLDESRPEVTHALLNFLHRAAGECKALYILGDLFESWIGDDDESPLSSRVSRALKAFHATGSDVYFMHGNRDFLVGEAFCERSAVILLPEPYTFDLAGHKTMLLHGDSLCTQDQAYQTFRKQVRDPAYQARILTEPLEERRKLALKMRDMSAEATSNKPADIMDVTESEVQSVMESHGSTLLIHGHTHRPQRHPLNLSHGPSERIVLGDWHRSSHYLRVSDNEIDLIRFQISA